MRPDSSAFIKGEVTWSCPITSLNCDGRYFLYKASPMFFLLSLNYLVAFVHVLQRGSPAHPSERTYPCCIPALGEFSAVMPHGGSGLSLLLTSDTLSACFSRVGIYTDTGKAPRRIRIAAECARLESVYRETYRGFKSLILRHLENGLKGALS